MDIVKICLMIMKQEGMALKTMTGPELIGYQKALCDVLDNLNLMQDQQLKDMEVKFGD